LETMWNTGGTPVPHKGPYLNEKLRTLLFILLSR
jgi:hypothetical protein